METLLGKTLSELQDLALRIGLPKFAGKQLAEWLYVRRVTDFDAMTNISLKGREALKAQKESLNDERIYYPAYDLRY